MWLQINSKSISGRHRRPVLSIDAAASPSATTAAASASFAAGRRGLLRPQQRCASRRPIAWHRRRRWHPRRFTRRCRLAVSMEASARPTDARASLAKRRGRHPQPRQSRVRIFSAARWVRFPPLSLSPACRSRRLIKDNPRENARYARKEMLTLFRNCGLEHRLSSSQTEVR